VEVKTMAKTIAISSGHGLYVRGASGILDEVDEARKVVDKVFLMLGSNGYKFHDNTSRSQSQNLDTIVSWHNSLKRDLDVSVHFNASEQTSSPMGCEVLYVSESGLAIAKPLSAAISQAGNLINRGPKKRTDLAFLNGTHEPAVLIETCFVDSSADADTYKQHFDQICQAIAQTISGTSMEVPDEIYPVGQHSGTCSWFGGPEDTGVSESEGLAFIYDVQDAPWLFLPEQPSGTTGLARRLDPRRYYIAMRWDYNKYPKSMLASGTYMAEVAAGGKSLLAYPADWGPHESTNRICDLSPGIMECLDLVTDDKVTVTFPSEY
jgi:N-acetylmuramoyl-L-alanine amidase